jgi:DedD protein
MDSRLKERLIGAAVLVVIGVWLIPWILDGPESVPEPELDALQLPAEAESAPVRTQTIDLEERRSTTARTTPVPAPATPQPATETPTQRAAGETGGARPAAETREPAPVRTAVSEPAGDETPPARSSEPAPTRTAAADPASAAAGGWTVQVGSFSEEANAKRQADRVASYGYKAAVSRSSVNGRVTHRVRVGPQESRSQAEAVASSLSAHGFVAQVVTVD